MYSTTASTAATLLLPSSGAVSQVQVGTTASAGSYNTTLTGLTASTIYYYRAYATNSIGTGYGTVQQFATNATPPATVPTITSFNPLTGPVGTLVTITGTNFTGATAVTFNTTAAAFTFVDATTITATVPVGTTTGTIAVTTPGGTGTSVGSFAVTAEPVVTTTAASAITATTATTGGSFVTNGATITGRGVVYGTSANPRIGGAGVLQGSTTAGTTSPFTSTLTGLTPGTTYLVAAYTISEFGTTYDATDETFATAAPAITATPATLSGFSAIAGTASAEQSYSLAASGLASPITVTAPTGYEVSLTTGSGFAGSVSVPVTGSTVYVRLTASAPAGVANGTITNVSGSTSANVALSGTVFPAGTNNCLSEGFETAVPPAGWLATGVTRSISAGDIKFGTAAAIFGSNNGSLTTSSVANPLSLTFYLGRTANATGKTLLVEVSTTSQTTGFTTVATFDHTNVPSGSYNPYTVDLSAYSSSVLVWVRYNKVSSTTSPWRLDEVKVFCGTAPNGPEINIAQNGANIASGGSYDFGLVQSGNTATATFTVQNSGSTDLTLTTMPPVALSGSADFVVTAQPATTIASTSSTTFTVTFTPSTTTAQTATLSIANNDATGGENPYLITLNGTVPPTYLWNGTGTSWIEPNSWTPVRATPAANDLLIFDGSSLPTVTVTTDFISAQTVGQLIFRNNVTATFTNTGDRALTISNGNTGGADLAIGSGSTLTVTSPSALTTGLTLQLASAATASIGGSIVFDNGAHRLLGTGTNSVELLSGSSFTQTPKMIGAPFGDITANANKVIFRNGSRLEQAGGVQPFGLNAPSTAITLEPTSLYVFSVPENPLSPTQTNVPPLSGRTFGNLEFNIGNGKSAASVANSTLVIVGDLTVTSGAIGLNLDNTISIGGNLTVNGSSTLTFNPQAALAKTVNLNGSAVQTIGGTAGAGAVTFGPTSNLKINNAAGVTLARSLTLNRLELAVGKLATDATNLLTLTSTATLAVTAGSFVNGPLARQTVAGPATVLFPVGKGAAYRPVTLNITDQTSATTYIAEQKDQAFADRRLTGDLTRVSRIRYFTVTPVAPPVDFLGTITLTFGADDQVTDPSVSTLVVAKNGGNGWENIGRGIVINSTITSNPFTSFSDFALASTDPSIVLNPLPVELVRFTAARQGNGVLVKWTTASEKNNARFEVLRSVDGREFTTISTVAGQGQSTLAHTYTTLDRQALATMTYYRLRQVDFDGKASLSPVVAVGATNGVELYPNPTQRELHLLLPAAAHYRVLSPVGRTVLEGNAPTGASTLDVAALPAGLYHLEVISATGRVVRQFVKQN
ncbi:hypothetical protein GCM10022408_27230 [Hymenobacter fastidiosus]|uniref:HYDIN/VesB/CFA65-like Ig-like domain-containing protein n=1 Tax=Hymenobacter fastidiosus TaxID=486264 RepID=A0ABP7SKK8_9BACT